MLNGKTAIALSLLMIGLSCSDAPNTNTEDHTPTATTQPSSQTQTGKHIDANVAESTLIWKGHKIMGSHEGELDLKSGYVIGNKSEITGGEFVVDMTSIRAKSLMDGGDDHDKSELAAHLRDGDFFNAPQYPTAKFVITNTKKIGSKTQVTGDMTIKDVTKPITFLATWVNGELKANVEIDRTKFNIKYGSGTFFENLGDRAIKDNFTLNLTVPFKV